MMRSPAVLAAVAMLAVLAGCTPTPSVESSGSESSSTDVSGGPVACDAVPEQVVISLLGPVEVEAYEIERLSECRWSAVDGASGAEIVLRIEAVPDAALFVAHSIEGTPDDRVEPVDVGEEGVIFAGEAALTRQDDHIALVTGGTGKTIDLIPVLRAAARYLEARAA